MCFSWGLLIIEEYTIPVTIRLSIMQSHVQAHKRIVPHTYKKNWTCRLAIIMLHKLILSAQQVLCVMCDNMWVGIGCQYCSVSKEEVTQP